MAASRVKVKPKTFEEGKEDPLAECELHMLKGRDKKGFSVRHINDQIDLAPSDYYLFQSLKSHLGGIRVCDDDELKDATVAWLEDETDDLCFKGKGVFTTKDFRAGEFLLEYHGELISKEEACRREKCYPLRLGSFLFFFRLRKKEMCIDATFSKLKGRYINDGCGGKQNSIMKLVNVKGKPHLAVFASRNIKKGEEVLYDYGVPSLPWRKNVAGSSQINHQKGKVSNVQVEGSPQRRRRKETKVSVLNKKFKCPEEGVARSDLHDADYLGITKTSTGCRKCKTQSLRGKELRSCSVVLHKLILSKDRINLSKGSKRQNLLAKQTPTARNLTACLGLPSVLNASVIPSGQCFLSMLQSVRDTTISRVQLAPSLLEQHVTVSSFVSFNAKGTCIYTLSTVSSPTSLVSAIDYPVTVVSSAPSLRSSTETVSTSVLPVLNVTLSTTETVSRLCSASSDQVTAIRTEVPSVAESTQDADIFTGTEVSGTQEKLNAVTKGVPSNARSTELMPSALSTCAHTRRNIEIEARHELDLSKGSKRQNLLAKQTPAARNLTACLGLPSVLNASVIPSGQCFLSMLQSVRDTTISRVQLAPSLLEQHVTVSSFVSFNAKGTCIYTLSTVSSPTSLVSAIDYPVTVVSSAPSLRSSTETVSTSVLPVLNVTLSTTETVSRLCSASSDQVTAIRTEVPSVAESTQDADIFTGTEVSGTQEKLNAVTKGVPSNARSTELMPSALSTCAHTRRNIEIEARHELDLSKGSKRQNLLAKQTPAARNLTACLGLPSVLNASVIPSGQCFLSMLQSVRDTTISRVQLAPSLLEQHVTVSSFVSFNAKGTCIYTLSTVSSPTSLVSAIDYPVTVVSSAPSLRSSTETVSTSVLPVLNVTLSTTETVSRLCSASSDQVTAIRTEVPSVAESTQDADIFTGTEVSGTQEKLNAVTKGVPSNARSTELMPSALSTCAHTRRNIEIEARHELDLSKGSKRQNLLAKQTPAARNLTACLGLPSVLNASVIPSGQCFLSMLQSVRDTTISRVQLAPSLLEQHVTVSSFVSFNAKGTCIYTLSTVSSPTSLVSAIDYPVTVVSSAPSLRSSTETVSTSVLPVLNVTLSTTETVSRLCSASSDQVTAIRTEVPSVAESTQDADIFTGTEVSGTQEKLNAVTKGVPSNARSTELMPSALSTCAHTRRNIEIEARHELGAEVSGIPANLNATTKGVPANARSTEPLKSALTSCSSNLKNIEFEASLAADDKGKQTEKCLKRKPFKRNDDVNTTKKTKGKPHRPCPYCLKTRSRLTNHLQKKHKDEPEVKSAMHLPEQDRSKAFSILRKKGIMKANLKLLNSNKKQNEVNLIRERSRGCGDIVYCSQCYAFVSKQYFHRHRRACSLNESSVTAPEAIPSEFCSISGLPEDFKKEILRSFHQDDVGKICTTDKVILGYGSRQFQVLKQKKDKKDERRTALKTDMRNLGRLFKQFQETCKDDSVECSSALDMFQRRNFKILRSVLDNLSLNEDGEVKSGLKISLGYLIKKVAKYIHGEYLIEGKEEDALELERFLVVLKFHWNSLFADAEYSITMKRQTTLRRPHNLPDQEQVNKLRQFTLNKLKELVDDAYMFMAKSEFSLLRDLVICRLTLFNARRGGEPSRLLIREWKDAEKDAWMGDVESIQDPLEKHLVGRYKLAYQPGKRERLVPLLIIEDCWKAINLLCSPEIRSQALVHVNNNYVFPSTKGSAKHVLGWHSFKRCCELAGLGSQVTATGVRHKVATLYASLEVPESDRKLFFEHMGHSEFINQNVYQSPPAVKEVVRVGKFLDWVDRGEPSEQFQISERVQTSEIVDTAKTTTITAQTADSWPLVASISGQNVCFVTDRNLNKITTTGAAETTATTTDTEMSCATTNLVLHGQNSSSRAVAKRPQSLHKNLNEDTDVAVSSSTGVLDEDYGSVYEPSDSESDEESTDATSSTSTPKKKRRYRLWKQEWSAVIKDYFISYIEDVDTASALDCNKGCLPGVKEIKKFIKIHSEILPDEDEAEKISRIRSKVFNDRKVVREKLRRVAQNKKRK